MRAMAAASLCFAFLGASGCMAVDYAVDPVGCGTGTHQPIFPWYPFYLWNPPRKYSPANPPSQIPGGPATSIPPSMQSTDPAQP